MKANIGKSFNLDEEDGPCADDPAWRSATTPLLDFITKPRTVREIRAFTKENCRQQAGNIRILDWTEDAIAWLERDGRIESFTDWRGCKSWRKTDLSSVGSDNDRADVGCLDVGPTPACSGEDYLTHREVMKILGVTRNTLHYYVSREYLICRRGTGIGRPFLYDKKSVDLFVLARSTRRLPRAGKFGKMNGGNIGRCIQMVNGLVELSRGQLLESLDLILRCVEAQIITIAEARKKIVETISKLPSSRDEA